MPKARLVPLALLALCLPPPLPLAGQSTGEPPRYHPVWWTRDSGLSGNWVPDITQDASGRLWIISGGLLTRFDGRGFEAVEIDGPGEDVPSPGLPIGIERGAGDTLWVATNEHRLWARTRGRWVPVHEATGQLTQLTVRPGSRPAAVESDGSRIYYWQGGQRLTGPHPATGWDRGGPTIALDSAGALWAVARDAPEARTVVGADAPGLEVATGVLVESTGGDPLGVRRRAGRIEIVDAGGRARASLPDAPGRVPRWLTLDGRVVATTPTHIEIHERGRPPARIPLEADVRILEVFEDREGGLWAGTAADGLLQLRRAPFLVIPPPAGQGDQPWARSIGRGSAGSVLVSGGRLFRVRGSRTEAVDLTGLPTSDRIFTAIEDARGTLWVGLVTEANENLLVARSSDGSIRRLPSEAQLVEVLEAPDGSVFWLTDQEVCRLEAQRAAAEPPSCTGLGAWGAHDLLVATDGSVWVAGQSGVRVEKEGRVRRYTPDEGFPLARARALYEDADGTIWIGTYFGGLGRLRGDSLRMVRRRDGLAEDVVSTILEDDDGGLWMGGNMGIHRVTRGSVEAFLSGAAPRVSSQAFGGPEGIPEAEGSGFQGVRDEGGRLWFPTLGGAVGIDPARVAELGVSPGRIALEAIVGPDSAYALTDTVRLPRGVRDLEVEVAAVSLRAPGGVGVDYRLGGEASGWSPVPDGRRLTLSGLPPGTHSLQVRATGPGTTAPPSTAGVVLVVPPRFAETLWFPLLWATLVAGLVVVAVRYRTRLLERRARELAYEVRQQTHWLEVERDRTAAALERVAEQGVQLRELLRTKSRVFAGLSHELRTPLGLLLGPLRELERGSTTSFPPAARGHLGTLAAGVRQLERLTGQFFELARTQSGGLRLDRREVDAGAFVEGCLRALRPAAEAKGIELAWSLANGEPGPVSIDPDHMDKVVVNLVENAIRHSPRGERVQVRLLAGADDGSVAIEVTDEGPGVPADLRERIFEPFFQATGSTGRMGLGLSLSRDIVVLHGGRIEVESPPGAGATFRVVLPAARGALARGVPGPAAPGAPGQVPEEGAGRGCGEAPRERVLVVEDDPALRSFLTEGLGEAYDVRSAGSGEEGLDLVREWHPDLVVSDVMMLGLDGIGLCRILKADPATRAIPVLLLTGLDQREDRIRGLSSGAEGYLTKPVDMEQLSLRIGNLLQLRRGVEDRFQAVLPAWASAVQRSRGQELDASAAEFLKGFYEALVEGLDDPDLDVDRIARKLFMSRRSLYRRVRGLLDCSPLDVLMEVRLERAALLLRTTDDAVATIAAKVGFRSGEHFARRFGAHFGLPPRAYRTRSGPRGEA